MSPLPRPLLLLANDDGIQAPGLNALREALGERAEVVTVAPEQDQSASGHALTLRRPLRLRELGAGRYALDGTPADCVYLALHLEGFLSRTPDLVVAGLNQGPNLGSDVFYSGTVAAAREGALRGVPSVAFSLVGRPDSLQAAAERAASLVDALLARPREERPRLLNVNFPPGRPRGMRATVLGRRHYADGITVRTDPRGRAYFWIGGPGEARHPRIEEADTTAIDEGWASLTPLSLTATDEVALASAARLASACTEALEEGPT